MTVSDTRTDRGTDMLVVMDALLSAQARSQRESRGESLSVLERSAYRAIVEHYDRDEPLTPASLGVILGLRSGSVTALVDRLEQAGLVVRHRRSTDRRLRTLEPSPDAETRLPLDWFSRLVVDAVEELPVDEWEVFLGTLRSIMESIEQAEAEQRRAPRVSQRERRWEISGRQLDSLNEGG